jgi:hypothetical protein
VQSKAFQSLLIYQEALELNLHSNQPLSP